MYMDVDWQIPQFFFLKIWLLLFKDFEWVYIVFSCANLLFCKRWSARVAHLGGHSHSPSSYIYMYIFKKKIYIVDDNWKKRLFNNRKLIDQKENKGPPTAPSSTSINYYYFFFSSSLERLYVYTNTHPG